MNQLNKTCEEVRQAILEEENPETVSSLFSTHLDQCEPCRKLLRNLVRADEVLQREYRVPNDFQEHPIDPAQLLQKALSRREDDSAGVPEPGLRSVARPSFRDMLASLFSRILRPALAMGIALILLVVVRHHVPSTGPGLHTSARPLIRLTRGTATIGDQLAQAGSSLEFTTAVAVQAQHPFALELPRFIKLEGAALDGTIEKAGIVMNSGDVICSTNAPQTSFYVLTPTAIVEVMGSSFRVQVSADGASRVDCLSGEVRVICRASPNRVWNLTAEKSCLVLSEEAHAEGTGAKDNPASGSSAEIQVDSSSTSTSAGSEPCNLGNGEQSSGSAQPDSTQGNATSSATIMDAL